MDGWLDGWMEGCCGFTLWHNFSMCRSRRHSHSISALWSAVLLLVLTCVLVSLEASSCVVCCTLSLYLNAACMLLAADDGFMSLSLKLFLNFKLILYPTIKPRHRMCGCLYFAGKSLLLQLLLWSYSEVAWWLCTVLLHRLTFSVILCGTECWKCNENCSASCSFLVHRLMLRSVI